MQHYLFHYLTNSYSIFFQVTLLVAIVTLVTAQYGYEDREYIEEVSVLNIIFYLFTFKSIRCIGNRLLL